jgi:hypothetical protein
VAAKQRVGNMRLHEAILAYGEKNGVEYPSAIKLLAQKARYREHRAIYNYVRGVRTPCAAKQKRIAFELGQSTDFFWPIEDSNC